MPRGKRKLSEYESAASEKKVALKEPSSSDKCLRPRTKRKLTNEVDLEVSKISKPKFKKRDRKSQVEAVRNHLIESENNQCSSNTLDIGIGKPKKFNKTEQYSERSVSFKTPRSVKSKKTTLQNSKKNELSNAQVILSRVKCKNEPSINDNEQNSFNSSDSGIIVDANLNNLKSERKSDHDLVIKPELQLSSEDSEVIKLVEESTSSDSEWEEVEEHGEPDLDDYKPDIPKEGVEIVIDCPDIVVRRRKKKQFDEMEYVRLHINRVRKDIQLSMHKVHLLSLLAHGFYINTVLNSSILKGMALSLIPSEITACVSGKKIDKISIESIEKIVLWFRGSFTFENINDLFVNISENLVKYFETKKALNASEYNLLFIVIARVLGFKTRLCISLYPLTFKAQNLIKKPNSKKNSESKPLKKTSSKKSNSLKQFKSEKDQKSNVELPSCSSTRDNKKGQKSKLSKKTKLLPEENDHKDSEDKIKQQKSIRPRRSVGKNYKISSDESDNDENDEDFDINVAKDDDKSADAKCNSVSRTAASKSASKKKNRKIISSDSDTSFSDPSVYTSEKISCWIEIFSKMEKQWISIECTNNVYNKPYDIEALAPQPITYVLAYDNNSNVKDVTRRYCTEYMTCTRKLRVDPEWWEETLEPFLPPNSKIDAEEERKMDMMLVNKPLPTTVAGFKDHPLYALKRHLLKFEAIYPPDAPPVGFTRGEPVYARDCVCQLHSRETWLKEARVVRIGEEPYKIVKARPKWDKIAGVLRTDLPLEIFGHWQTEPYEPPVAKDGKVPRNEYGNVELFKPCMLPRGTVHLQIPGVNRIARKLGIDCSPAVIGFDGHKGSIHPVFDGFIVCEEYKDTILAAWEEEQENARKRGEEKREKRIYGNWKKLIRGLLIRERIKLKYDVK